MKIKKKPEMRFSKFEEDWQKYKLGEIYKERKEKGQDSLPILSVSIRKGISDEELDTDSLGKLVLRSEDKSLYKHVYPGDLVLNMMRAWQGAYGVVTSEGMVSPAYITAKPSNQIFPPFMDYCLRRNEIISQINNFSYGVTDFRKRLYWNSFIKVSCYIPSISEQKRITSLLTKLDKSISIHRQELVSLKQTKQGFLQKMFPKAGQSVPEIRFQGFTDDWQEFKAGTIFHSISDKNYTDLPVLSASQEKGMVLRNQIGIDIQYNKEAIKTYKRVTPNQFVIHLRSFQGGFAFSTIEGVTSPAYTVMDFKDKEMHNSLFWKHVLSSKTFIKKLETVTYGIRDGKSISFSDFSTLKFKVPLYEEQTKISNFLQKIDELTAIQQQELEALEQTKKAFLQKMFV